MNDRYIAPKPVSLKTMYRERSDEVKRPYNAERKSLLIMR
jgi:hypothetical protein